MGWSLSCPLDSSHLSFFACLIADKRGEATLSSVLASHHAAAAAANPFNMGYPFVSPYPTYSNGDPISMPMVSTFSSSMNCRAFTVPVKGGSQRTTLEGVHNAAASAMGIPLERRE